MSCTIGGLPRQVRLPVAERGDNFHLLPVARQDEHFRLVHRILDAENANVERERQAERDEKNKAIEQRKNKKTRRLRQGGGKSRKNKSRKNKSRKTK